MAIDQQQKATPDRQTVSLDEALAYQQRILPEVSRTFALTIPQLPPELHPVIANAYLLCRIADTIEDDPGLTPEDKSRFQAQFVAAIAGHEKPHAFAIELASRLSAVTLPAERELVANSAKVLRYTHTLDPLQRGALLNCVSIMCRGMGKFQRSASLAGLPTLNDLDQYCYFVAGVVGEMLTELFCHYDRRIEARRDALVRLASAFGQGLQLTNIIKDVWEDRARGVCWWPREVFAAEGIELANLETARAQKPFGRALGRLVGVAHGHLHHALSYTLCIPRDQTGIRRFCLWAIGLAILTLQNVQQHHDYRQGGQVKVTRRRMWRMIRLVNFSSRSNWMLKRLFEWVARDLPYVEIDPGSLPSAWREPAAAAARHLAVNS